MRRRRAAVFPREPPGRGKGRANPDQHLAASARPRLASPLAGRDSLRRPAPLSEAGPGLCARRRAGRAGCRVEGARRFPLPARAALPAEAPALRFGEEMEKFDSAPEPAAAALPLFKLQFASEDYFFFFSLKWFGAYRSS